MDTISLTITHETADQHDAVEHLAEIAFGPGRFARAAFRLREGVAPDCRLSFVALVGRNGDEPVLGGSVRVTPIRIGDGTALVLGPLIVSPDFKNLGIGRELMHRAIHEARVLGYDYMILVGDHAYYSRFGFERIAPGRITLPGPADPLRILGLELVPGAAANHSGPARRFCQNATVEQKDAGSRGT